jgi:hypothetical protein
MAVRFALRLGRARGHEKRRECLYYHELDMETLVCPRGLEFSLSRLETRLRAAHRAVWS